MADNPIVNYSIDDIFTSTGIGSLDKAIGLNISGFDQTQNPAPVPRNKEHQGFVFFTRPQLNLQNDNIRNWRLMYDLLSKNEYSLERFIRCTLDPRLNVGYVYNQTTAGRITTPLVQHDNAFIPFMTNNCISVTGWPEQILTTHTSKPDVYNGTHTSANGVVRNYGKYTLNATFRNTHNDPLVKLIHYWMLYTAAVTTTGELRPYADMEQYDVMDYNTRIYRIVLDVKKQRVTKIFACGAAIPVGNAVSVAADYNRERPYSDQNKDLTIPFECDGMIVMDPILVYSFNGVVQAFCPEMKDANRDRDMIQIDPMIGQYFRYICYPRIEPSTYEFQWWAKRDMYNQRASSVLSLITNTQQQDEFFGD